MLRSDFSYELPPELIAQEPRERGRSRMMVVTPPDKIVHDNFIHFPERLDREDTLVINDTRVIPARLFAKPKGAMQRPIEVLLIRPVTPSVSEGPGGSGGANSKLSRVPHTTSFLANARDDRWEAWCKPARRVRVGDELRFSDRLTARVLEKSEGTIVIRFEGDVAEIERIGMMPLPPYIRRPYVGPALSRPEPAESRFYVDDRETYQTIYANEPGAIAAPTAGLHFTRDSLDRIASRGIEVVRITLHVGIGTFEPVKVEDIAAHIMHSERFEISEDAAAKLNAAKSIVAVGTTTVRALESAIRDGRFEPGRRETSIFITPGYEFKAVDKLLTNFHLPESTLLMLVSAFAGVETIRRAYAEAIREKYRFYSYGDCMFITKRGLRTQD